MKLDITYVDFKTKTVKKCITQDMPIPTVSDQKFNMSNFKTAPSDSNFAGMSDKDRFETSEHILNYLHELTFDEVLHFIDMGVLDKQKAGDRVKILTEDEAFEEYGPIMIF